MKKIYIATPVNARREATLEEKRQEAYQRVRDIEYIISKSVKGAEFSEFHSAFDEDIAPIGKEAPNEPVIMGRCVQRVMECDMIVLDYNWESSKGCIVEQKTADEYAKSMFYVECHIVDAKIEQKIKELVRVRRKG